MKKIAFYLIAAVVLFTACDDFDKDLFKYQINAPITDVELNETELELARNATVVLKASVKPEKAINKDVTWSSSNTEIASVSVAGEVSAKALGTAIITVTAEDGGKTATCTVTVVETAVSRVRFYFELDEDDDPVYTTDWTIIVDEKISPFVVLSPSDASDKSLEWTSSDPSIATVNSSGAITGVGPGTVTITATSTSYNTKGELKITVLRLVESVELNEEDIDMGEGDVITLQATVFPDDASNKNVKWFVSSQGNANIIAVEFDKETGIVSVTALEKGYATITAMTEDGEFTASCEIAVGDHPFVAILCGKTGSKIWTWDFDATPDPDEYGPWSMGAVRTGEPDWWSPEHPDDYVEGEEEGATMTFSATGKTLVKERTDGSKETGTFRIKTFEFDGWDMHVIGQMHTNDVTVLSGKCTESDDPVYQYDIIKLTESELQLAFPADGVDVFDEWGTCTYWYFKAK